MRVILQNWDVSIFRKMLNKKKMAGNKKCLKFNLTQVIKFEKLLCDIITELAIHSFIVQLIRT